MTFFRCRLTRPCNLFLPAVHAYITFILEMNRPVALEHVHHHIDKQLEDEIAWFRCETPADMPVLARAVEELRESWEEIHLVRIGIALEKLVAAGVLRQTNQITRREWQRITEGKSVEEVSGIFGRPGRVQVSQVQVELSRDGRSWSDVTEEFVRALPARRRSVLLTKLAALEIEYVRLNSKRQELSRRLVRGKK